MRRFAVENNNLTINSTVVYHDVIIIGAGPAGCACALALKHSGLNILLVDKSSFPRDKTCGDAIGGRVKMVLKMIDPALEKDLEIFEEKTISKGWKLFSPSGRSLKIDFIKPGYVSKRIDFDNFLFENVKQTTTQCLTNVEIKSFRYEENLSIVEDQNGNHYQSKIVLACDGAHSSVVRSMKPFTMDQKHYSGAVRAYYQNIKGIEDEIIEIHLVKNFLPGYFWIFPLKNNISNVGFGMLSSDISKRKIDLKKALNDIIKNSPELSLRFKDAKQEGSVRGFGLPLGGQKRRLSGKGYLLCGDAASLIDPLNGEGIGNAMLSGYEAAKQVIDCFKQNNFSSGFLSSYDKKIEQILLPELKMKLLFQRLFNRPWLIDFLVSIAASNRVLREWLGRKL